MKIVVIEDELLVRNMLVKIAVDDFKYEVVGEASDGEAALELCRKENPDLLLVDIYIPKMDGITVAEILMNENPDLRILSMSLECDLYTIYRVFKSGIHGYVDKLSHSFEVLQDAIKLVASGRTYYSRIARDMWAELGHPKSFSNILSKREIEFLPYIARGLTNEDIAKRFDVSLYTIRNHRNSIFSKLGVENTPALMRYAIEKGIWKHKSALGRYLDSDEIKPLA